MNTTPVIESLAIEGGKPAMNRPTPVPVRWGEPEAEQIRKMLDQNSLFYWRGPQTELLKERFREHYPFEHVMGCSSGTASLHIAVAAAGIGLGDEVITSPVTDMGTVIGVLYQQAVPVFADLDPHTYNLDVEDVRRRITSRTKAIIAVHLAGNPCETGALRALADEHGLVLIEDCAQAWGARCQDRPVGLDGHLACYSLNDFKHIGCGDGGLVASNDSRFGPLLQTYGDKAYCRTGGPRFPQTLAPNYRISEPQSAVAAVQMQRMKGITERRAHLGSLLGELLAEIPGVQPHRVLPGNHCSFWFYMFRLEKGRFGKGRDDFAHALRGEGAPASAGYISSPIYEYPVFQNHDFFAGRWPVRELGLTSVDYREVCCPSAEELLREVIYLPVNQAMDESWMEEVAGAVKKVAGAYAL